jgi:hypothetical protein
MFVSPENGRVGTLELELPIRISMESMHAIKQVLQGNTTTSLLDGVVRWLKTEPSPNDAEWQAHADLVQACLAEMVEMSVNPSKGELSRYVRHQFADKLNRAMPHIRSMLTAMWERDPTTALAHGEITSAALPRHSGSLCFPVTQ